MPYWGVYCLFCQGYISDALLECIPESKRTSPAFRLLDKTRPGAALAAVSLADWAIRHRFMKPGTHDPMKGYLYADHPLMKLSREELAFLRHWMYDEVHFQEGTGPAKMLQREKGVKPGELAELIVAGIPDLREQESAGYGPPPAEPPQWPWSAESFAARLAEAEAIIAQREKPAALTPVAVGADG